MSTSQHQSSESSSPLEFNLSASDRADQKVVIKNRKTTIGSHPDCSVVLNSDTIQPVHCMLIQGEAGTVVRNFHADTRINGESCGDQWFAVGDTITLGHVELRHDNPQSGYNLTAESVSAGSDSEESAPAADPIGFDTEKLMDLVERLTGLESELTQLKDSNIEYQQKVVEVEQNLVEKLGEIENLENSNLELRNKIHDVAGYERSIRELEEHAKSNAQKTEQLESKLDSKDNIICQFANTNSQLASELTEFRHQLDSVEIEEDTLRSQALESQADEEHCEQTLPDATGAGQTLEQTESKPVQAEDSEFSEFNTPELGDSTNLHGIEEELAAPPADPEVAFQENLTSEVLDQDTLPATIEDSAVEDLVDESPLASEFSHVNASQEEMAQEEMAQDGLTDGNLMETEEDLEGLVTGFINSVAEQTNQEAAEIKSLDPSEESADQSSPTNGHSEDQVGFQEQIDPLKDDPFKALAMIDEARSNGFDSFPPMTPEGPQDSNATVEDEQQSDSTTFDFSSLYRDNETNDSGDANSTSAPDSSTSPENEEDSSTDSTLVQEEIEDSTSDLSLSALTNSATGNVQETEEELVAEAKADSVEESWEANFRKEFRDELANKAATYSPKPVQEEVNEEKREEIACNIARVESDLNELFRPKETEPESVASDPESIPATGTNETEIFSDKLIESHFGEELNSQVPGEPEPDCASTNETEMEQGLDESLVPEPANLVEPTAEQLETGEPEPVELGNTEPECAVPEIMESKVPEPESRETDSSDLPQTDAEGELEFNFELAESNLAGAFADLFSNEESGSNEDSDSETLEYTESAVAADSQADDISDEQVQGFFEAANESENTNPYASFLNDSDTDSGSEQAETDLSQLADGLVLPSLDSEDEEPTSEVGLAFSELFSNEGNAEAETDPAEPATSETVDESTGLTTSFLIQEQPHESSSSPVPPQLPGTTDYAAPVEPKKDETDDSYIQEYMKRLLGNHEEVPAEVSVPVENKEQPSLLERTFEREIKERQEMLKPSEFVPKTSAPEKNSNLQAMRELANQSARSAIETSSRKRKFEQQSMLVLIFAGICFFIGASLAMISKTIVSLPTMGAVVFFALTGVGAWYYFDLKGNTNPKSSSEKTPDGKGGEAENQADTAANAKLESPESIKMEPLADGENSHESN